MTILALNMSLILKDGVFNFFFKQCVLLDIYTDNILLPW
jgi:hypothetical protein